VQLVLSDRQIDLDRAEVLGPDGQRQGLTSRECALLAYLAARPAQDVSREELHDKVWGLSPQVLSRACDSTVRRLRRKIEADAAHPVHLLTAFGSGYRLVLAPPSPAASEGITAPAPPARAPARRPPVELGTITVDLAGMRLRRGDEEVDLTSGEAALLASLIGARGAVLTRRRLGQAADRQGDRAVDAAISRLRQKLLALAGDDSSFIETVRGEGYRLVVPTGPGSDGFVGRGPEQTALAERLRPSGALVVIVGPAGVGKTRLADRLARRELDGFAWCSLGSVSGGPDAVARALAAALEVDLSGDAQPVLAAALRARGSGLVVVDNVEHLVGPTTELLTALRRAAPSVRWLLTSQVRLGMPGEQICELAPLTIDEGVALFTEHAPTVAAAHPAQTRALVSALEGLPLAIELAAARATLLPPDAWLQRIDQRLDLLRRRSGPARHQTLRAAIEWSVHLASPAAATVLMALSLAPAGLTTDEAEELARRLLPDERFPLEILFELRDRHLVTAADGLSMLDAIRLYARDALAASPDRDRIEAAVVELLGTRGAALPQRRLAIFQRWSPPSAARALLPRLDNYKAAALLALSRGQLPAAIGAGLVALACFDLAGPYGEGIELASELLAAPGLTAGDRAEILLARAILGRRADHHDQAIPDARQAADAARRAGDLRTELRALQWIAVMSQDVHRFDDMEDATAAAIALGEDGGWPMFLEHVRGFRAARTDLDSAAVHYARCRELAMQEGDRRMEAVCSDLLGGIAWYQGQLGEARAELVRADGIYRAAGENGRRLMLASRLCQVLAELGEVDAFHAVLDDALRQHERAGAAAEAGLLYAHKGEAHSRSGAADKARAAFARGRAMLVGESLAKPLAFLMYREAEHHLRQGDWPSAARLARTAADSFAARGFAWDEACARGALGLAQAHQGDLDAAQDASEASVAHLTEVADPTDLCVALCRLGRVRVLQGRRQEARDVLQRARQVARRGGVARSSSRASEEITALEGVLSAG